MWIVAVGWIYVVVLMAATETSVVAGIMTFFGYCVLPLSILFYITGSKRRRARKAAATSAAPAASDAGRGPDHPGSTDSSSVASHRGTPGDSSAGTAGDGD